MPKWAWGSVLLGLLLGVLTVRGWHPTDVPASARTVPGPPAGPAEVVSGEALRPTPAPTPVTLTPLRLTLFRSQPASSTILDFRSRSPQPLASTARGGQAMVLLDFRNRTGPPPPVPPVEGLVLPAVAPLAPTEVAAQPVAQPPAPTPMPEAQPAVQSPAGPAPEVAPEPALAESDPPPAAEIAPEPPPAPVPAPVPPPRIYKRPPNKWGVGVYLQGGPQALEALRVANPGVILLMNPNWEFAKEVRRALPRALIIGRLYFPEQPLDDPEANAAAAAEKVLFHARALRDEVDAWMSYNEPLGHNDYDGYRRWNRFQVAFAHHLHAEGNPVVAGNDPPGAIEPHDYPRYFAQAIRASDYLGLHISSRPDADTFNEPSILHYGLRHRLIHQALEEAGLRGVPMVATESGLYDGWRHQVSGAAMAREFAWLTRQMAADDSMLGHAAFGLFAPEDPHWQNWQMMGTEALR